VFPILCRRSAEDLHPAATFPSLSLGAAAVNVPGAVSRVSEMSYGAIPREPTLMTRQFTAIVEREDDGFVALCPELAIASQGNTIEETRANLQEALQLFLETASPEEIKQRLREEVYVTRVACAAS
jgi:predicted RNase H-like HicB family nuclease